MECAQIVIQKPEIEMFFVDTTVSKTTSAKDLYEKIFSEINTKIYQYGIMSLNNYKYGFCARLNHVAFEDLLTYREILKMKINCDDCLCDFSINDIIAKIKTLTNSIC